MLYICATPIGNLKDISLRALEILSTADIILCEDTRVSSKLLHFHNITAKKLIAYHEHNEANIANKVITWLKEGLTIVQISDAGTPGISDPGSRLCKIALAHGFTPHPIPGACAYISLLSVSGLNCPHLFLGFLSSKKTARQKELIQLKDLPYLSIIYEAPHRIKECLNDIIEILGADVQLVMGRELTKQYETIIKSNAKDLLNYIIQDVNQQKGEFILIIKPNLEPNLSLNLTKEQIKLLKLLQDELAPKKAVNICHGLLGGDKDQMYQWLVKNKTT